MQKVPLNGGEAGYLNLFRIALSEPDHRHRLEAIRTVKLEVQSDLISLHVDRMGGDRPWGPEHLPELIAIVESEPARLEAAQNYVRLLQRYEGANGLDNERKLNLAEQIGKMILLTIREKRFDGVQTPTGILEQVRQQASDHAVRGGVDKDTIRKAWSAYQGVVHLGIAMDLGEDQSLRGAEVLRLAEGIRLELSTQAPRGRSKPYVVSDEQISFVNISKT